MKQLPNTFQFKHPSDSGILFTATLNEDSYNITWDGCTGISRYSMGSVARFIEDGTWEIVGEEETLLSRIKAFTQDTNASVFIVDGKYEIYYNGECLPAKADTDEDVEKLMEAIVVLDGATY